MLCHLLILLFSPVLIFVKGQICDSKGDIIFNFGDDYNTYKLDEGNGATEISAFFTVEQIVGVNDIDRTLDLLMLIQLAWRDQRILSNTDCYAPHISDDDFHVLWKPEYTVFNGASVKQQVAVQSSQNDPFNTVFVEDGVLFWDLRLAVTVYCEMDFRRFPLDVQICRFRIMSRVLLDADELVFVNGNRVHMDQDEGVQGPEIGEQRELAYDVSYEKMPVQDKTFLYKGNGNFNLSAEGFDIVLERRTLPYMLNIYMPTAVLVFISWISFFISPNAIPGRMGLLVTLFLVLTNISTGARANSPNSGSLTTVDTWLLVCTAFVAAALCEYAVLLFFIRQAKNSKRRNKGKLMEEEVKDKEKEKQHKNLPDLIDKVSLIVAPILFLLFVIIYSALS